VTRPQTLAYALTDSPVGQLAWIVEKFKEWARTAEVPEDAVDRDQPLTNVMLYWLTGTAGSSADLYYENAHADSWYWASNLRAGRLATRRGSRPECARAARCGDGLIGWEGPTGSVAGSAAPGQVGLHLSQVGVPVSPSRRSTCTQREGSATLPGRESGRSLTAAQPDGQPTPATWGLTCKLMRAARDSNPQPPDP
jgi:hypothetical protein